MHHWRYLWGRPFGCSHRSLCLEVHVRSTSLNNTTTSMDQEAFWCLVVQGWWTFEWPCPFSSILPVLWWPQARNLKFTNPVYHERGHQFWSSRRTMACQWQAHPPLKPCLCVVILTSTRHGSSSTSYSEAWRYPKKTLQRPRATFYTKHDRHLVKEYVRAYLICQKDKMEPLHPAVVFHRRFGQSFQWTSWMLCPVSMARVLSSLLWIDFQNTPTSYHLAIHTQLLQLP